jgi:hypothetical protein
MIETEMVLPLRPAQRAPGVTPGIITPLADHHRRLANTG